MQVFRNGIIEAVNSSLLRGWNGKKCIPSVAFEESLVDGLKKYLECQKSIGIEPPLFVMLSFLGVRGYSITVKYLQPYSYNEIDRDVLILTEVMIQSFEVDLFVAMKPIFDAVWNAAGFQGSLNYDEKGIWDKNRKY